MNKKLLELSTGEQLPVGDWITISQADIDMFAKATNDHQWIHVDPERCEKESPFATTIAHGYLTVTLMPNSLYQSIQADPVYKSLLNYGVDKIRFIEPVRVNDKIRFVSTLLKTEQKSSGKLFYFETTAEIEGRNKPAMKGVFLTLLVGAA
ncbi:MaoC family dehydratase [Paraglaciecola arctica]|uniref:Nodulation protein N n=1 Tax=Paraglaciecola arctica BSs20135 TaxID=493475 RepID=K6YRH8_9ALTE|nr:MaoC family dehydratase [Paraglaciecola arctica]GAC19278.1 nodulation protein N [Paraglaciecola arctica BSs20135]|tara:strand:- start:2497 stop:2949 length:453 start_codon:yes stop_codon:yes gene_type:complete